MKPSSSSPTFNLQNPLLPLLLITMKLFSVFIIFILLLQVFAEASLVISNAEHSLSSVDESSNEIALHKKVHPRKINCSYACSRRCRKASRKNVCSRACKTCCKRCHCVPPGTYGNKNMCPCYASLKTHGHKPKCP